MKSNSEKELVELTSVQGEMEGKIIHGILESEGITALVKSDIVHSVHPISVDGLGEVKIFVQRKDLTKAKVVLKEYREGD